MARQDPETRAVRIVWALRVFVGVMIEEFIAPAALTTDRSALLYPETKLAREAEGELLDGFRALEDDTARASSAGLLARIDEIDRKLGLLTDLVERLVGKAVN